MRKLSKIVNRRKVKAIAVVPSLGFGQRGEIINGFYGSVSIVSNDHDQSYGVDQSGCLHYPKGQLFTDITFDETVATGTMVYNGVKYRGTFPPYDVEFFIRRKHLKPKKNTTGPKLKLIYASEALMDEKSDFIRIGFNTPTCEYTALYIDPHDQWVTCACQNPSLFKRILSFF